MNDLELRALTSFVDVVKNFFGNCRVKNYKLFVEKLLKSLQDIGANMSIVSKYATERGEIRFNFPSPSRVD